MDLGAFAQIGDIEAIAAKNGIDVPRLRGYRLMRYETYPLVLDNERKKNIEIEELQDLIHSDWNTSCFYECSRRTDRLISKYIRNGKIQWNKIHGCKRKQLKLCIKHKLRYCEAQYEVWNRYLGAEDVLYIHARIGGRNWNYYKSQVVTQSWFIEKVDDAWDGTYCDIYARLKYY